MRLRGREVRDRLSRILGVARPFRCQPPRTRLRLRGVRGYVAQPISRLAGSERITRFDEPKTRAKRSFCTRCGTPLFYERASAPKWVNIPRALLSGRTGREPRYHLSIQEKVDWAYMGEPLAPLKGYPGVMWVRPKRKKSVELPEVL